MLKVLVLQWTNFPWNIGPGDYFFRENWSAEPFFSGKIGPGDYFFHGILVRETIFSLKISFMLIIGPKFHGKFAMVIQMAIRYKVIQSRHKYSQNNI